MQRLAPIAGALLLAACAGPSSVPDARPMPSISRGAEPPSVELDGSLDAYLEHSLAARPELHASWQRWRAQEIRVDTVDELPSPTLTYGYFLSNVETRVGPQRHRAGLQQPIPWPGKTRSRRDVELARVRVEEQRYDSQALDIAWQVADAYWQLWEIERIHGSHEEHVAIVESLAASARTRVETSQALVADVGQMELSRSRASDMVSAAHATHHRVAAELAWAAGLSQSPLRHLPVTAQSPRPRIPVESEAELIEAATQRPAVMALALMQAAREQEAAAARFQRYPDFGIDLNWIETGPAADPSMEESGKDALVAGVSIRLPLWTGEFRAAEQAAEAEALALQEDREAAERLAARQVQESLATLAETARRIRLYETTLVPQAEAVLGSVKGAYEVGRTGVASLLHAQHELLELRIELSRAQAEHEREWAMLERVVARPVPSEVPK